MTSAFSSVFPDFPGDLLRFLAQFLEDRVTHDLVLEDGHECFSNSSFSRFIGLFERHREEMLRRRADSRFHDPTVRRFAGLYVGAD